MKTIEERLAVIEDKLGIEEFEFCAGDKVFIASFYSKGPLEPLCITTAVVKANGLDVDGDVRFNYTYHKPCFVAHTKEALKEKLHKLIDEA